MTWECKLCGCTGVAETQRLQFLEWLVHYLRCEFRDGEES